jgi:hypothetical protein
LPPGLEKRRRLGAIRQHGTRAVNHPMRGEEKGGKCTCWVIMRGDTARPDGWESAEYELAPNPSCPVHGRKLHPLLEDEEVFSIAGVGAGEGETPEDGGVFGETGVSRDEEAMGQGGDSPGIEATGAAEADCPGSEASEADELGSLGSEALKADDA